MAQLFVSSTGLERRGRKPNCYSYSSPFPNPHQEWQIKPKFSFLVPEFWKRTCSSAILTKWNVTDMSTPLLFGHQSDFGSLQEKRHTPIVTFRNDSKFCHKISLLAWSVTGIYKHRKWRHRISM